MVQLLGPQDQLLRTIERQVPEVRVAVRGNLVRLTGDANEVGRAAALVRELVTMVRDGVELDELGVTTSKRVLDGGASPSLALGEAILSSRGRTIRAKTPGQRAYVDAIEAHTI